MEINVALTNNLLPDKYGKHAAAKDIKNGKPIISFPIKLSNIPAEAKTIALTFTDPIQYLFVALNGFTGQLLIFLALKLRFLKTSVKQHPT
jgi:Phospholipid-binding protein